ncbi:MAG TPA: class I SAM-dependent methyltransferase [Polyangia bacterium]|nr:class I SAM-dependent methyltransferase [Polyangia bacterium]
MAHHHDRLFRPHHAHKLDDPERQKWLPPDVVVRRLARPGLRVADVGAGTGYFALPLARAVLPGGRVFAIDMQPEMLQLLPPRVPSDGSVVLVEGEATRTTLPNASVDVVLLANVWHELDDRGAALSEASRILVPEGRIAVLDWREDVGEPVGPPLEHRIPAAEVARTLEQERWRIDSSDAVGSYHYLIVAASARSDS